MTAVLEFMLTDALIAGVFPATQLATPDGWRMARHLRPGQKVLTQGKGTAHVVAVEPQPMPLWAQQVPERRAGIWGAVPSICLAPGQLVLMDTGPAAPGIDEIRALVAAEALEGWRGITAVPNDQAPLLLRFERPVLVPAGPGLTLGFPGPDDRPRADDGWPQRLHPATARALVARLIARDLGADLAQAALGGRAAP